MKTYLLEVMSKVTHLETLAMKTVWNMFSESTYYLNVFNVVTENSRHLLSSLYPKATTFTGEATLSGDCLHPPPKAYGVRVSCLQPSYLRRQQN